MYIQIIVDKGYYCIYIKHISSGEKPVFEWDETKSEKNREDRGFGFEIILGFDWQTAVVLEDDRLNYGERRFRAFGYAEDILLAVAFTFRGTNIRIISIRRMHAKEGKRYGF